MMIPIADYVIRRKKQPPISSYVKCTEVKMLSTIVKSIQKEFSVLLVLILTSKSNHAVKVSDFLNFEYLPSTIFLEEAAVDAASDDVPLLNLTTDGDVKDAFMTMQYHRSMMNEYLCRSYVADEILTGISEKNIGRLGVPAKKHMNHKNHRTQDTLLNDQGSSSYKNWLSRSTLLGDIYRHYDQMGDSDETGQGSEEMETGEVTGYAVQNFGNTKTIPSSPYGPPIFGPDFGGGDGHGGGEIHFSGGSGHGTPEYGGGQSHGHGAVGGDEHYYYTEEHSGKGLALKDLFDLALTALAFLAFGLFVMNLIMNCMIGNQGTTVVMQTSAGTGEASTATGTRVRSSRSILDDGYLNEMAYRVLNSIDNLTQLNEARTTDSRACLQYSLCQNNKYSRTLNGKHKMWLPIWSFGLSWLSGKLGEDKLSNLQASILGLGNANCAKMYASCPRRKTP
ncbi:uncharacterized protein LOC112128056 [Cimex lectularius]|uniref:Uncharacterized protein n=1 Tax=Cimex lectularius TaxID=79782 RepID=A0A8I6SP17_CIMLE|nr:uncharacterized protein LOC112128056 [Cimex lectularius]